MEGGKDNRSKDKRNKMKQHQFGARKQNYQRTTCGGNTSSSSQQAAVHSIVDVADSSDEPRFARRKGWGQQPPSQRNRERLNMDSSACLAQENSYSNDEIAADYEKENAQLQAGDFKEMAQLSSGGGHFAFNEEKQWNAAHKGELPLDVLHAAQKYFTLNLKLLNTGLQTIPFYKRMDYASSMFTVEQLNLMNKSAEQAEKRYQNVLHQTNEQNPSIRVKSASQRSGSAKSAVPAASAKDELDELLDITTAEVAKVELAANGATVPVVLPTAAVAAASASDTKDDIQNWLDNVLEE